jgi:hypothetical protein
MKLTGFFAELNFSTAAAEKAITEEVERQVFRAWDAWLTEFIRIVPVWSGASVGTILPVAEKIGRSVSINAPQGQAPGNRSSAGAAASSATLVSKPGLVTIEYRTALMHLLINNAIDARVFGFKLKKPGPYNFDEACGNKFLEVIREARLPDLTRFFDFDTRSF